MYDVPVISVNGHDVNALVKAANIAMAWRFDCFSKYRR